MTTKTARKRPRHNAEGGIRKRPDGTWEARYTAGWTPEGKQVRKSVYGRTRTEVAEKLKAKLAAIPKGAVILAEQRRLTLGDYLQVFLDGREAQVSPGTHAKNLATMRLIKKHEVGGVPLPDLKPAALELFYRTLAQKYAASTVRHVRVLINLALKQAVRHEILAHHPGLVAELPRMKDAPERHIVPPEELARILPEARKTRHYALFALIATLGVRHGEALGFQWQDLDLEAGTLTVVRTVVDRNRKAVVSAPKTDASARTLYVPPALKAVLLAHRRELRAADLPTGPESWIFPSKHGNPMIQRHVRAAWAKTLKAANVETPYRIHDLRHTFISRLIEAGADPKTAADLAGHTDPRMTLSIYTHTRGEQRKKALLLASENLLGDVPEEEEEEAV